MINILIGLKTDFIFLVYIILFMKGFDYSVNKIAKIRKNSEENK